MRITTLNHKLNTSNVTNMASMFKGIEVERLDLSTFNTSKVTNMSHMFEELDNNNQQNTRDQILILNIQHFDYSKVTDASYMFARRRHYKLTSYNFEFGEIKDLFDQSIHGLNLEGMFSDLPVTVSASYFWETNYYPAVEEIFSPIIKTDRAINCKQMFRGTQHKKIDLYDCDFTKNVINMDMMFSACRHAEQIDICSFTSQKLQTCQEMFSLAQKVQAIRTSFDFRPDLIADSSLGSDDPTDYMFGGCESLGLGQIEGSDVTRYDSTKINGQMAKMKMGQVEGYFCGQVIVLMPFVRQLNGNKYTGYIAYTNKYDIRGAANLDNPLKARFYNNDTNGYSLEGSYAILSNNQQWLSNVNTYNWGYGGRLHCSYNQIIGETIKHIFFSFDSTISSPYIFNITVENGIQTQNYIFRSPNIKAQRLQASYGSDRPKPIELQKNTVAYGLGSYNAFFGTGSVKSLFMENYYTKEVQQTNSIIAYSQYKTKYYTVGNNHSPCYGCNLISKINTINFDTSNVTDMHSMFRDCNALTLLDVANFDTSNVTDMSNMFSSCHALTSLDVANFDTSNVTDMSNMFYNCRALTSLDTANFDTSNVTSMGGMFSGCTSLTSLDVANFDTSNVTGMYNMFYSCNSLTSLDVTNFNTSSVTSMSYMFGGCNSLTTLDVTNFNTSNVTSMNRMFNGCNSLTTLDVTNFNTSKVTNMEAMFYGCRTLASLDVANFNTSNVTDMSNMFRDCDKLISLDLSNFNTSSVTSMSYMFGGCNSLTTLDVTNFNTSNVTSMNRMFNGCNSLTTLDVTNFNTSKVTNMEAMFYGCRTLASLDVANFNTSNVTDMSNMFRDCDKLISLDLSNFNTSNVTDMTQMFNSCDSLTSLDITNFNTFNVTKMEHMFGNCDKLTLLDVTNFNTSNVSRMNGMFNNCTLLKYIIVSTNFDTTNATISAFMFDRCLALTGSKGTIYNPSKTDKAYARIDNAPTAPGYFWSKEQWIAAGSPTT